MPRKQTVNRRYNQFVYGGLCIGKIFHFDQESVIKFQYSQDIELLITKLDQIKSEESRAYHKFILTESGDYKLKQLFAFFIYEILISPDILNRCRTKAKRETVYFPSLFINEIERQIRRNESGLKEFYLSGREEVVNQLNTFMNYLLTRFESFFLYEMLKQVKADIILVCDGFRPEYLHNIPQNVKGIITRKEEKELELIRRLATEFEIPIAQCTLIYPDDEIAIINGEINRITFNPDKEDLERFYEKYYSLTFKFGEIASYGSHRIKLYAEVANANHLDRITSYNWYDGIGPFNTEFFFMTRGILPTIDNQVEFFVDFFNKANGLPIYLKVPDFTPDKPLKYMEAAHSDTGFIHSQHQLFFDNFTAIAKAVKATKADVKIVIPKVVMASELSDWKRHVIMAYLDEDLRIPEFGYVLETEAAYEFYNQFPRVDFVIIGFDNLVEENSIHFNRYTELSITQFNELFLPLIKDIHEHLNNRYYPTKHILAGNVVGNPFIFRQLINYGFTDFSIPLSKIRVIEETFTEYCNSRGRFVGVYRQERMKRLMKQRQLQALNDKDKEKK